MSERLDPDRWRIIREIFDAALDMEPGERAEFVAARAAGDASLQAEVLSLLEAEAALEEPPGGDARSSLFLELSFGSLARLLGSPPPEPPFPTPPFRWGPLEVLAPLGAGSFGRVYRAHDPTLRRDVALKLRPVDEKGLTQDGEMHLEEARRLAQVRHPNVIVVHGAEVHDGYAGIWTDLVRGETLDLALRRNGPFPRDLLARVAIDLCQALHAVHSAGIVHGDVKPSNAMRDEDGRVLLMDFGSGRHDASATDDPGAPVPGGLRQGTPVAMAPELWRGDPATVSSDLYAAGVLLYRVATGQYPFRADAGADSGECIPLEELRPDLPSAFARVVHRALEEDPARRPVSARELGWSLAASLGSDELASDPSPAVDAPLPQFSTRFVGRASELRQLRSLLTDPGLVTLVGPGGCGKTRLAARIGVELGSNLAGGVVWVDLAALEDGEQVARHAAHSAELTDRAGERPDESLVRWIGGRAMLVVIDNAEHLRESVALLAERLTSACPGLRLLITSRQRLAIGAERVFRLSPMGVPPERAADDALAILESDSVRLFLDRARRSGEEFRIVPDNASDVARIVRRVEGIPLAVELAAARVGALGVKVLADRLEESFQLLNSRGRTARRHSTLANSIEWSFGLLEDQEARLFTRLAVFSGGWGLSGAEAVCAGEGIDEAEVVDLLSSLVEHSLVSVDSGSEEPRYRLLEMVRIFALERLEASDEAERLRDRHLAWIETETAVHGPGIHGPEMKRHIAWLDREHGNIRAALQRWQALSSPSEEPELRWLELLLHLRPYWVHRGHLREGSDAFRLYSRRAAAPGTKRVLALTCLASIHWSLGETPFAIECATEAVEIARRHAPPGRLAIALATLGSLLVDAQQHDRARDVYLEALAIRKDEPNPTNEIVVLCNLGVLEASTGDLESAQQWYERALELARLHQDESALGHILGNLALTMIDRGDLERARPFAAEGLSVVRRTNTVASVWTAARPVALLHIADAHWSEASLLLREVLEAIGDEASVHARIGVLDTVADLLIGRAQKAEAVEILGAIDAEQERASLPIGDGFRARWERRHESLRSALPRESFDAAWVRGRLRSSAEAMELARRLV